MGKPRLLPRFLAGLRNGKDSGFVDWTVKVLSAEPQYARNGTRRVYDLERAAIRFVR